MKRQKAASAYFTIEQVLPFIRATYMQHIFSLYKPGISPVLLKSLVYLPGIINIIT